MSKLVSTLKFWWSVVVYCAVWLWLVPPLLFKLAKGLIKDLILFIQNGGRLK